jgi:hypothetical protein
MAVTISGSHFDYDNVKDTFPQSTSLTGGTTIDGVNNGTLVTGTGTLFTTELQVGEYLYIAAQSAFRKIRRINSNTELVLESAFPTATFSDATAKRVPLNTYRSVSWAIDSAGTAKIDNITMPASQSGTMAMIGGVRPEPILIDSTANGNNVNGEFQI